MELEIDRVSGQALSWTMRLRDRLGIRSWRSARHRQRGTVFTEGSTHVIPVRTWGDQPPGVYVVRLGFGGRTQTGRLVLVGD